MRPPYCGGLSAEPTTWRRILGQVRHRRSSPHSRECAERKQHRSSTTDSVQTDVDQLGQHEGELWIPSNPLEDHLPAEVLIEIWNGIYVRFRTKIEASKQLQLAGFR